MCISLLFLLSTKKELNNFSIISALVATVPRLFFSISVSKVPSFKYGGGFVLPVLTLTSSILSKSFSNISGIVFNDSSSSSPYASVNPRLTTLFPFTLSFSPSHSRNTLSSVGIIA